MNALIVHRLSLSSVNVHGEEESVFPLEEDMDLDSLAIASSPSTCSVYTDAPMQLAVASSYTSTSETMPPSLPKSKYMPDRKRHQAVASLLAAAGRPAAVPSSYTARSLNETKMMLHQRSISIPSSHTDQAMKRAPISLPSLNQQSSTQQDPTCRFLSCTSSTSFLVTWFVKEWHYLGQIHVHQPLQILYRFKEIVHSADMDLSSRSLVVVLNTGGHFETRLLHKEQNLLVGRREESASTVFFHSQRIFQWTAHQTLRLWLCHPLKMEKQSSRIQMVQKMAHLVWWFDGKLLFLWESNKWTSCRVSVQSVLKVWLSLNQLEAVMVGQESVHKLKLVLFSKTDTWQITAEYSFIASMPSLMTWSNDALLFYGSKQFQMIALQGNAFVPLFCIPFDWSLASGMDVTYLVNDNKAERFPGTATLVQGIIYQFSCCWDQLTTLAMKMTVKQQCFLLQWSFERGMDSFAVRMLIEMLSTNPHRLTAPLLLEYLLAESYFHSRNQVIATCLPRSQWTEWQFKKDPFVFDGSLPLLSSVRVTSPKKRSLWTRLFQKSKNSNLDESNSSSDRAETNKLQSNEALTEQYNKAFTLYCQSQLPSLSLTCIEDSVKYFLSSRSQCASQLLDLLQSSHHPWPRTTDFLHCQCYQCSVGSDIVINPLLSLQWTLLSRFSVALNQAHIPMPFAMFTKMSLIAFHLLTREQFMEHVKRGILQMTDSFLQHVLTKLDKKNDQEMIRLLLSQIPFNGKVMRMIRSLACMKVPLIKMQLRQWCKSRSIKNIALDPTEKRFDVDSIPWRVVLQLLAKQGYPETDLKLLEEFAMKSLSV